MVIRLAKRWKSNSIINKISENYKNSGKKRGKGKRIRMKI